MLSCCITREVCRPLATRRGNNAEKKKKKRNPKKETKTKNKNCSFLLCHYGSSTDHIYGSFVFYFLKFCFHLLLVDSLLIMEDQCFAVMNFLIWFWIWRKFSNFITISFLGGGKSIKVELVSLVDNGRRGKF